MLHFRVGMLDEANALVERWHYSGRPPAAVQCVGTWHESGGLFGDYGDAVAACFFSIPGTRWSEDVWELSRLVRAETTAVPLTGLIAATCAHMRRTAAAPLLVSFADSTQGHHGGIYQAASWSYAGKRDRRQDGLMVDGTFVPGRSCNSRWGTRSPSKLQTIIGREVIPHYDEGKHLYWRALNKDARRQAARLGLDAMPYPKPAEAEAALRARGGGV